MEGVSRSSVCIDQMGKNRVVFIKLPRERALTKMSKIFSYIYSDLHNVLQFDFHRNVFGSVDGPDTRCRPPCRIARRLARSVAASGAHCSKTLP